MLLMNISGTFRVLWPLLAHSNWHISSVWLKPANSHHRPAPSTIIVAAYFLLVSAVSGKNGIMGVTRNRRHRKAQTCFRPGATKHRLQSLLGQPPFIAPAHTCPGWMSLNTESDNLMFMQGQPWLMPERAPSLHYHPPRHQQLTTKH